MDQYGRFGDYYHGIRDHYLGIEYQYHGIRDHFLGIEYQYHGILHRLTIDCSYTAKAK